MILGRGAAVILHDDERALHVLLDAPKEARVRQAMEIEGLDQEAAERRLARVDRFRRAYVETFYGVDLHEPGVCHLVHRLDRDPARRLCRADRGRGARPGRGGRAQEVVNGQGRLLPRPVAAASVAATVAP